MAKLSKTFKFNKIAFWNTRRINTPEIEVELRDTDKGPELSICGSVWNSKHTDCLMCGQCLDELVRVDDLHDNEFFMKLYRWWKKYHLNGMHAGTSKQEKALKEWHHKDKHKAFTYDEDCKYLEHIGLLNDDGYEYGSSWLYEAIPDEDLNEIKALLSE